MTFMAVALASMGPVYPRWTFTFEATEEELAEARAAFGEPYDVVGAAQIQIGLAPVPPMPEGPWTVESWAAHHRRYTARRVSWDMGGPVSAATIAGLVEACPSFTARTS